MGYARFAKIFQNILRKFIERLLKEISGGDVSNTGSCDEAGKMDCLLYRRR